MRRRRRVVLIVGIVVVLLGLIVLLNIRRKDSGEPVETRKVGYGSIHSRVSATGKLRAAAQVSLQSQVMGTVAKLFVKEGDWVTKGQPLILLDRQAYEAQLLSARARFTQAQLSHARVESLFARRLVPAEQFEASKAALEMAEAQYNQAQDQFEKTLIRAPISGTVSKVNIKEGEAVMIGTMNYSGTVLLVIADMSRMQALVEVDETEVVTLRLGQPAEIEVDALPDTSFSARVTKIGYMPVEKLATTAGQEGVNFEVELTLDSTAPMLRPGMSVHAEITTATLDSVLVVPLAAVGRREVKGKETSTVFVVRDGKAVLRPVKTGRASDTETEVVEGLEPGEEVITGPFKTLAKLKDGHRVSPKPTSDSL
ncbi:MAG: efflux RND transporter periplasmic adaptor subunit [candidate division WOR-3 bacterium]